MQIPAHAAGGAVDPAGPSFGILRRRLTRLLPPFNVPCISGVQGCLAFKEPPPRRTMQQDHAWAPVAFLGRGAFFYARGTPVGCRAQGSRSGLPPLALILALLRSLRDPRFDIKLGVGGWGCKVWSPLMGTPSVKAPLSVLRGPYGGFL